MNGNGRDGGRLSKIGGERESERKTIELTVLEALTHIRNIAAHLYHQKIIDIDWRKRAAAPYASIFMDSQ